jgi:outer membrane protein assembly factor BamA
MRPNKALDKTGTFNVYIRRKYGHGYTPAPKISEEPLPGRGRNFVNSRTASLRLVCFCLISVAAAALVRAGDTPERKRSLSAFPYALYSTDIGFGFGGMAKMVNYLHRDESLALTLFYSTKSEHWYLLTFSIPDFQIRQGKRYRLSLDFKAEYDKYLEYYFYGIGPDSQRLGIDEDSYATYLMEQLSLTIGHAFSPTLAIEAAYVVREYRTSNVAPDRPFSDRLTNEGNKFSPFLSLTLRYDTSNSQIHPTRGVRLSLQNDFAGPALGNKAGTFYRWTLDLRAYHRVFGEKDVVAVRGLVQDVIGSKIPLWDLSMLGGGSTMYALRGYVLNRFIDKGKFLACAEYRFPIWKRIGGTVFAEGGSVWPFLRDIELKKIAFDAGFGLRYYLSDFVVRADIGFSHEGMGVYFNAGHMF